LSRTLAEIVIFQDMAMVHALRLPVVAQQQAHDAEKRLRGASASPEL